MNALHLHTWTLRQRVVALCLAVGLVLSGLAIFAAVTAADNRANLDTLLNRTGPMRLGAESLNSALVDQETGMRGFALRGREGDLDPYTKGLATETTLVDRIDGLLGTRTSGGYADARRALDVVVAQARAWRTIVAEPVIAAVRSGGPAAGQALLNDAARVRFDALRASVGQLQKTLLVLRDNAVAVARGTNSTLVWVLVVGVLVILLAGAVLLIALDRLVSRPVVELAAQARRVADGDYELQITSVGSPELAGLADDIDAMRRQIAAELAQVREARAQVEQVNGRLHAQTEELSRSNRDLEQFAYVASHDLQEPLRKVASFCQLLQRRYAGQIDDRADQYIAFAVDGAQRMQRLINDLLAFSRIGRVTGGFVDVDLNEVLREAVSQLEARRGDAEITVAALPVIKGEEPLLTTLFVNLIGNSLKFRRSDAPSTVHVSADRVDGLWQISVADNGIGIEAEFADKVFVIFQRLHARDAYEGTGIGLAIVKKIVEYHGGRIWLGDDFTEGTKIVFTIPVVVSDADVSEPVVSEPVVSNREVTA